MKKIELKKKYKDSETAYFYLGLAHFAKNSYREAREAFIRSNELKTSVYLEYLIALCEALTITTRIGAFVTLTEEEVNRLKDAYSKISSTEIEKHFRERRKELVTGYWLNRLAVLLHVDGKKALDEYDKVPKSSKQNPNILITYADILHINGETEKSYEILKELHNKYKKPDLLIKILDHLVEKGQQKQILKIASAIKQSEFDNESRIGARILDVTYREFGITAAEDKAKELLVFHKNPIFIHFTLGEIFAKEKKTKASREHFEKSINCIQDDNYPPRRAIAESCLRNGFLDLTIDCLKPFIVFNDDAKKRYIEIVLRNKINDQIGYISKLIDETIKQAKDEDINFWLNAKANLEYSEGRKRSSLQYLKKLFEIQPSPEIANNIVGLKIELNEPSFYEYAQVLEKREESNYLMMAAICYKFEGNKNLVDDLSYKALAKNGDKFDEVLFTQYIQLHFFPSQIHDTNVELERVELGSSIQLTKGNESLWITLESDKALFRDQEKLSFAGSTHISSRDEQAIQLREHRIKDKVTFEGKQYQIATILTKKAKATSFCVDQITRRNPSSPFLKAIQVTEDDPITPILPQLIELEKHKEELFDLYNMRKHDLGLPLWSFAKEFNNNLLDSILNIMSTPKQPFFTGEVVLFDLSVQKIVLSPVSIILLSLSKELEKCQRFKNNIYITTSTIKYFRDVLDYIIDIEKDSSGSLGMEGGKPYFQQVSQEMKTERKDFFIRILELVKSFKIKEVNVPDQELDDFSKLLDIIGLHEFESIKLAKTLTAFYVTDDLASRKIHNNLNSTNRSSNSIAVLFNLNQNRVDNFLGQLLELSKASYLFLFNQNILLQIVNQISKAYTIIGPGTIYDTFDKIIRNCLTTLYLVQQYEPILLCSLNTLYENQGTANYDYFFKSIIKSLKTHYGAYDLDYIILRGKLKLLDKMKATKQDLFLRIYDEV